MSSPAGFARAHDAGLGTSYGNTLDPSEGPNDVDVQRSIDEALEHLEGGRAYDGLFTLEQAFAELRCRQFRRMERFAGRDDQAHAEVKKVVAATKRTADRLQGDPAALERCGQLLFEAGATTAACSVFERVVQLAPTRASAHYNHGIALRSRNAPSAALSAFDRCLRRVPDWAAAHNYRSLCLRQLDRPHEARDALDTALGYKPYDAQARFNRGLIELYLGNLQAGWSDHEARWLTPAFQGAALDSDIPAWSGEQVAGRHLLLWAEQGLGDTIQFVRFARRLADRGATVTLRVQPSLVRLLASVTGAYAVQGTDNQPATADAHAPLHSVPHLLGLREPDLHEAVPYLAAEPALIEAWRGALSTDKTNIGVIWRGGPSAEGSTHRSFSAEALWPLAHVDGVTLIALQKERAPDALVDQDAPPMVDVGEDLDEGPDAFVDTAALMTQLDLVVTCDTATAHLAGALGCSVWLALPWTPDWRWQRRRADSPWYPTMRLFRPTAPGDWDGVMRDMARRLASDVLGSEAN